MRLGDEAAIVRSDAPWYSRDPARPRREAPPADPGTVL